jgi:hypothetical protein
MPHLRSTVSIDILIGTGAPSNGKQNVRTASDWLLAAIFLIVCAACLSLSVVAVLQSVRELRTDGQRTNSGGKNLQSTLTVEEVKAEFDRQRDRTDNLQKLITTLIALSSLYAIVLTVTGYLNVSKVVQDAKALLTDAEDIKKRLREDYGSIGSVLKNLDKSTRELKESLPDVQELSLLIGNLPAEKRERIYFQEKAVAFAQLVFSVEDSRRSRHLAEALVGVARFYRGLYLLEKKKLTAMRKIRLKDGTANDPWWKRLEEQWIERRDGLLERALFYARQGVQRSANYYIALNELGSCLLEYSNRQDAANEQFTESLRQHPEQQKALYHLSLIEHKRGDFVRAEEILSGALGLQTWENIRIEERRNNLHYNRACAYAKQAEGYTPGSKARWDLLEKCFTDLQKSKVMRAYINAEDFRRDLEKDGDLVALAGSADYVDRLKEINDHIDAKFPPS